MSTNGSSETTEPQQPQDLDVDAPADAQFPIVGVGASAGGLEAFSQLLAALPPQPGLAIVFIQHLDPHHASMLSSLLGKASALQVSEARDGMRVEKDHLYVISPNTTLTVADGKLRVTPRAETHAPHMPIDRFLRSLAAQHGSQAIGVLLSGGGTDGTLGMIEIKSHGGITFAQDHSATQESMPRSAINEGCVDMILSPRDIGERLSQIGHHSFAAPPAVVPETADDDKVARERVLAILLRTSGVDFSQYKISTVQRRIQRRMALDGIDDLKEYVRLLQKEPAAAHALYQDLLVRVTSFFRDRDAFSALEQNALPQLVQNRSERSPLRVWVAGCATGEEAYSVAIVLLEALGDMANNTPIKILATDISEKALEKARAGRYTENIELDVSQERLRRFFNKTNGHYQISKAVRDLCVFARHNLTRDPPFSRMDLVTCRNVLIYLDTPLHRKILRMFHYALSPTGFLMLGQSEGVGNLIELFAPVDEKNKLFRRKTAVPALNYDFQGADFRSDPGQSKLAALTGLAKPTWDKPDVQREADRVLLARFAPAGVVVDENLTILQFRGDTSPYLAPAPGTATLDLLRMVRDELKFELRAAVNEARVENVPVRKTGLVVRDGEQLRQLELEVLPIRLAPAGARCLWVLFEELPKAEPPKAVDLGSAEAASSHTAREAEQAQLTHLQQELDATRAYLQSLIEEHEATNEELKSAHEEVLSSNEELQSMNEELQTAKEEMQSANEELATLNDELKHRNHELGKLNDDLINLLGGVNIPIIMLSRELCIRRFTPQAERLLNLIPTDTGRPVTDIRHNLNLPDFEQLLRQVIAQLTPQEREVQDNEGRWWSLRVQPYVTQDNKIDGATMVALDIDMLKRKSTRELDQARLLANEQLARANAEQANRMKDEFLAMLAHELRNPLAPVMTSIDILRHLAPPEPQVVKTLDVAERQIVHMARLLDDLLDVSRITQGKIQLRKQPVEVKAAVEQALETVRHSLEARKMRAAVSLPAEPIVIEADPTRFEQIVVNLLNNAIKYTPEGGQIAVAAHSETGELVLTVSDTGIGISPAMLPRIFELFVQVDQTLDRTRGGLGIGLTLVRRLTELHGGSVQAASAGAGQGSQFTVRIPIGAATKAQPLLSAPAAAPTKPLRVLVVDDIPDIARSLATLLTEHGHEARVVHSGRDALAMASEFRPQAVLLDIGLPEIDGYEVARRLRKLPGFDKVLIAALTGYGQDEDRARSREAGFDHHLVKPVTLVELQRALATAPDAN